MLIQNQLYKKLIITGHIYIIPKNGNFKKAKLSTNGKILSIFKMYNIYAFNYNKKAKRFGLDKKKVINKNKPFILVTHIGNKLFLMKVKSSNKTIFDKNDWIIKLFQNYHSQKYKPVHLPKVVGTMDWYNIKGYYDVYLRDNIGGGHCMYAAIADGINSLEGDDKYNYDDIRQLESDHIDKHNVDTLLDVNSPDYDYNEVKELSKREKVKYFQKLVLKSNYWGNMDDINILMESYLFTALKIGIITVPNHGFEIQCFPGKDKDRDNYIVLWNLGNHWVNIGYYDFNDNYKFKTHYGINEFPKFFVNLCKIKYKCHNLCDIVI